MEVIRMLKFDTDDAREIDGIMEKCQMTAAFFQEDSLGLSHEESGLKAVQVLRQGHPVEMKHLQQAFYEVEDARQRVGNRVPNRLFLVELKEQYLENLSEAKERIRYWMDILDGKTEEA